MSRHVEPGDGTRRDWDAYWRNAGPAPALREGGTQDEVLERFWSDVLDAALAQSGGARRLIDVASGNGAVVRFALEAASRARPDSSLAVSALDSSVAALNELRERNPEVHCVVADVRRAPFPSRSFDFVTSQFGIEYAGAGAIVQTARLVAPGGMLAAILHLRHGGIFRECSANLAASDSFRRSGLLRRFDDAYRAAWAVKQCTGTIEALHEADRIFESSARRCERTLARFGREVASGALYRMYQDVRHMRARLGAYDPDEIVAWLDRMGRELDSYAGRMSSMVKAALDTEEITELTRQLADAGFRIRICDVLKFGRARAPSAWTVVADRSNPS